MNDDRWTEDRVLANSEESFYFERKAGKLLNNRSEFKNKLGKAISAFSNSEGGSIVLGVQDDGSFDGVDEYHKGRARTSEWLGDVIKTLVVPRVQLVHIQEVEPAVHSLIPKGKVLIVIEVEKSEFAPHQSTDDNIYYYRVDKQSNAAPHNLIENLFLREKFPGPRIAEAWVYTVLNSIINVVEWEGRYLAREQWGFDRFYPDRLEFIRTIADNPSGNYRQFFEHNPGIYDLVQDHDEKVRSFIDLVKLCYVAISQSADLQRISTNATSLDSLRSLQDKSLCDEYYNFKDFETREQFMSKLFSPRDPDDVKLTLTQYVLNNAPKLSSNITFAPLWNLFYDDFVLLRKMHFASEVRQLTEFTAILKEINTKLLATLIEERRNLCYKHHIPPDEPLPTVVQAPSLRYG